MKFATPWLRLKGTITITVTITIITTTEEEGEGMLVYDKTIIFPFVPCSRVILLFRVRRAARRYGKCIKIIAAKGSRICVDRGEREREREKAREKESERSKQNT